MNILHETTEIHRFNQFIIRFFTVSLDFYSSNCYICLSIHHEINCLYELISLLTGRYEMIDSIDVKILSLLQKNARISNAEIARQLNMAPSGILERIRKLKERGIIEGYVTCLNPKVLNMDLLAYVFIKTNEKREKWDVAEMVAEIPEVLEIHDIAGEDCYLVKLRTKSTEALYELLRTKFGSIPSIASTRTTIVLRTIKETTMLPLDQC